MFHLKSMRNLLIILLYVFLSVYLSVYLSGCMNSRPDISIEKDDQEEVLEFNVAEVTYRDITRDIEGLGNLVYYDKATVISRIDGVVERIFVKKGDMVEKGEKLLELSNFQLELEKIRIEEEVLSAEEELETAKMQYIEDGKNLYKKFFQIEKLELQIRNYEKEIKFLQEHIGRKKILFEKGGIPEEEFRNLVFSLESKMREFSILEKEYELQSYGFRDKDLTMEGYGIPADEEERRKLLVYINTKLSRKRIEFAEIRLKKVFIELERINWLLSNTVIRSPIEGVVTDIPKHVGEKVNADEAVTTILNQDRLIARVSFSETDLSKLKKGGEVMVFVDSLKTEVKGRIHTIDPYIDVNTRTFSVDCLIDNTLDLVPGMFIKVRIPVLEVERFLLVQKKSFIRETENKGYVYVVSGNNRIFKKEIFYEGFDDEFIVVIDGVKDGDIIVQNPLMNLMDGMKIVIKEI